MKLLVETTGNFMLIDPTARGQEMQFNRPSVVAPSQFVTTNMASGRLSLLSNELLDEATDNEFLKFYMESGRDKALAVASFLSKFSVKKEVVTKTTPAGSTPAPVIVADSDPIVTASVVTQSKVTPKAK